jgi:prepilin-type N-terminal cleavage/methylation domain-containing protein
MKTRRGFTLTEVVVVIGIIVIILALAVPAFNFITGARSIDAAQNLVAAMVGRARAEAIAQHRNVGVCFFRDPVGDRTTLALVTPAVANSEFTFDKQRIYKNYVDAPVEAHEDYFTWVFTKSDGSIITCYYLCVASTGGGGTAAIGPPPPASSPPAGNANWEASTQWSITTLPGLDFVTLPPGIGAQLVNDPVYATPTQPLDRFLRAGVIMFDEKGRLIQTRYVVDQFSKLGVAMGLNTTSTLDGWTKDSLPPLAMTFPPGNGAGDPAPLSGTPAVALFSQVGVLLYDRLSFRDRGFSEADVHPITAPSASASKYYQTTANSEQQEEKWLSENGVAFMVNRYSGSLLRQE